MADLPAQNPAVDPASPQNPGQQPVTTPAEQPAAQPSNDGATGPQTPVVAPIELNEEQKTYLKSQGIEEDKLTSPEAVLKLVNHATTLKRSSAEAQAQLDKIKGTVAPEPQVPSNPLQGEPASQQPQQGQAQQPQMLDDVSAFNLATSLSLAYPDLKEDFTSGNFYKNMAETGIPMHTQQGTINFSGIQKYAELATQLKKLEASPNPDTIPNANPSTPQQPDENFEMDRAKALAILAQDPNHARAEEAKLFLQKTV